VRANTCIRKRWDMNVDDQGWPTKLTLALADGRTMWITGWGMAPKSPMWQVSDHHRYPAPHVTIAEAIALRPDQRNVILDLSADCLGDAQGYSAYLVANGYGDHWWVAATERFARELADAKLDCELA
jgi:hypothetical protein